MNSVYEHYEEGETVYIIQSKSVIKVFIKSIEHISDTLDRYVLIDKNQRHYTILINALSNGSVIFKNKQSAISAQKQFV